MWLSKALVNLNKGLTFAVVVCTGDTNFTSIDTKTH